MKNIVPRHNNLTARGKEEEGWGAGNENNRLHIGEEKFEDFSLAPWRPEDSGTSFKC